MIYVMTHYKAFEKNARENIETINKNIDLITQKIIKVFKNNEVIIVETDVPLFAKFLSKNEYLDRERVKDAIEYMLNVVKLPEYTQKFIEHFIDIKLDTFLLIQDWYECRKRLHILNKLKGDILDVDIYEKVVKAFYMEIRKELLKGHVWNLGFGVGEIEVTRIERRVRFNQEGEQIFQPDWKESMLKKKEIKERGGTPRSKKNPDGEDWLIPNKEKYMVGFNWKKNPRLLSNAYHFEYVPLRGQYNPATELYDYRRENIAADLNYRIIERKKSK